VLRPLPRRPGRRRSQVSFVQRAVTFITDAHPEWAHDATLALTWCRSPTDDPAAVRHFLDGFATWVAQQLRSTSAPS
jgi:hypothetical protein